MTRITTKKEIEAVLRLDGPARFEHFVKRVADSETAWGLWKDGWVLMGDESGASVFPLWPAREYAELMRAGDWAESEPSEIELEALLADLLPKLRQAGVAPGIFPTPSGRGVVVMAAVLEQALRLELERYESK